MAMRFVRRVLVSSVAVLAMVSGFVAVPTPAFAAAPANVPAANGLRAALSGAHGLAEFVDGLAGVGAFGLAAPGLTTVPGAKDALDLRTVLAKAVDAVPSYAAADSPSALADAING